MKNECHHCRQFAELSTYWHKKPDGSRELVLICQRCAFLHAYKFIAYILGKKEVSNS